MTVVNAGDRVGSLNYETRVLGLLGGPGLTRPSGVFGLFFVICSTLFTLTWFDAWFEVRESAEALERHVRIVSDYGLTDLSLFTEARYTRHLSQADLHSAFQDHPHALEHFPSGSLVQPPPTLQR